MERADDTATDAAPQKLDRLERLLDLVATLLDAGAPLGRATLVERVPGYPPDAESARRQLGRDLQLLRELGMPIETIERDAEPDDRYVYALPRDELHLPDLGLAADEAAALQLAVAAVAAVPEGSARRAIHKLGGTEGRLVLPDSFADIDVPEPVISLFAALGERRRVRYRYNDEDRLVDPWGLSSRGGRWYLRAFDHGRGEGRTFRVDRIQGDVVVDGPPSAFDRPADGASGSPPPPWLLGEDVELVAEVLVDPPAAEQAVLAAGTDTLAARHPDGSVTLRIPVANREALRSFVLGFLDAAEVVGPPDLRAEVVAWLEGIAARRPAGAA